MFERFTTAARETVIAAEADAVRLGHGFIGTEHLLLAVLRNPGAMAYGVLTESGVTHDAVMAQLNQFWGPGQLGPEDAAALSAIGIDLDAVRAKMAESFGPQPPGSRQPGQRLRFTARAKKVLELSLREALALKHRYIGSEHILLALIREKEGLAARAIIGCGVALPDLRTATLAAIGRAAA
jgi:ATP-dependent Clp protease ATP-binding subunit ClpA